MRTTLRTARVAELDAGTELSIIGWEAACFLTAFSGSIVGSSHVIREANDD